MTRDSLLLVALIGALGVASQGPVARGQELIHETDAGQYGLARAWNCQAQVDANRGKLQNLILDEGSLFVQTDQAITQAIDAVTGKVLWTVELGTRGNTSLAPGMSHRLVAVVNGSNLYVLNRANGKLLWKTELPGAPGAGPAVSYQVGNARVYVPLVNGKIAVYRLKLVLPSTAKMDQASLETLSAADKAARTSAVWESLQVDPGVVAPTFCQSPGRALVQPLLTRQEAAEEFVAWGTDQGYLCIGRVDRNRETPLALAYRLQTEGPILAQPAYLPADAGLGDSGIVFAASQDGFVHAIKERDGSHLWRFSTGGPIAEAPAVAGRFLFVTNQMGGMYCLKAVTDSPSGEEVWHAPEVTQFVAASKQRIYAADKLGQIHILDGRTGSRLSMIPTQGSPIKVANGETDRIYLANKTGLIQCLHEAELAEPLARRRGVTEVDDLAALITKPKATEEKASEKPTSTTSSVPSSGTPSKPKSSKKSAKSRTGNSPPGYEGFDDSASGKKANKRSRSGRSGSGGGSGPPPGYPGSGGRSGGPPSGASGGGNGPPPGYPRR